MPRKTTRNAQGGGTIRQRPDGRWEGRVTLGRDPGTGKQVHKIDLWRDAEGSAPEDAEDPRRSGRGDGGRMDGHMEG